MLQTNIYLIGFMGSGKTYWGRKWSHEYEIPLLELDDAIVAEAGMSIPRIFDLYGEDRFRKLERQELHLTEGVPYKLISCGGGTPCFFDNMDWMLKNGTVIYLKSTPDNIYTRLKDEAAQRPLLQSFETPEKLKSYIEQTLRKRRYFYEKANLILNTTDINIQSIKQFLSTDLL